MKGVIRCLGLVWAALGALNLYLMPWQTGSQTLLGFGLIFNMILFVLPGLALYAIATPKSHDL